MRRKGHEHMIAIIDYDAGNIKSVEKAMHLLGQEVVVTRDRESDFKGRQSNSSGSRSIWRCYEQDQTI